MKTDTFLLEVIKHKALWNYWMGWLRHLSIIHKFDFKMSQLANQIRIRVIKEYKTGSEWKNIDRMGTKTDVCEIQSERSVPVLNEAC